MKWWEGGRDLESGWGWGRDARTTHGAYHQVCTWDGESLGGMGYAPPGFSEVLQDLGVPKNKAKETVAAMVHLLKEATKEMWEIRCYRQRAEELEIGITDDAKRDNGAASRWRATPGHGRARPRPGGERGVARHRHGSEEGEEEEGGRRGKEADPNRRDLQPHTRTSG